MYSFIISLGDATAPRGGDVTARSMSNIKEGVAAAKNLWGETNLTRSVLRLGGKEAACGKFSSKCLHIRPVCCEPTVGPEV